MNDYEQRKADRIERQRARGARLAAEGNGKLDAARTAAACIPFGQPIHVGHHSEGRDRRFRERIHATEGKGHELRREGAELAARADRAEASMAVSSDDPSAVEKLREKLATLAAAQDRDKAINRIVLPASRKGGDGWREATAARLVDAGLCSAALAQATIGPDFAQRYGVPGYVTTNRASEIRRIEQRIEVLARAAATPPREPVTIGDATISEDRELNRVQIRFPGKPDEGRRARLKSCGFRWAPSAGAWQRQASPGAWAAAEAALKT
jgi:hypothetical protein